jgi:hypothetical protein
MEELRQLKIGRACYRVRHRNLDQDLYGQIHLGRRLLDLADDLEGEEAAYATLHEALHGIWDARGVAVRAREETVVTNLAWGLVALFRDNPGLLSHLDSLLKESR